MFTADPVTGARDEIAIDAAWGWGEAIVGGLVTPDRIVADKATGEIPRIRIAEKAIMTVNDWPGLGTTDLGIPVIRP